MRASQILTSSFATMAYLYSFIVFVFYFGFLMPPSLVDLFPSVLVPYNIHRAATVAVLVLPAWVSDSALLALFCMPHSLLAHDKTKSSMKLPKVLNLHECPVRLSHAATGSTCTQLSVTVTRFFYNKHASSNICLLTLGPGVGESVLHISIWCPSARSVTFLAGAFSHDSVSVCL